MRYWAAWFRLRYRQPLALPVPVPAVLQFLVDHLERTQKDGTLAYDLPAAIDESLVHGSFKAEPGVLRLSTIEHRLAVLSKAHQLQELPSPTRDPAVQELMRRSRRAYATRGQLPTPKPALTRELLEAMLVTCTDGLVGLRDRALLTFTFSSGGRRRSEVAAAAIENLTALADGTYLFRLGHSKSNQAGTEDNPNATKPLVGPAAEAMRAWLEAANITSGPIFRRIRKTKAVEPLSPSAVWFIVKRRARLAGLEADYGAHSLRSGFVTEAGRQNVPMGEAMALTGHRSTKSFLRYFQPGAISRTRGANLLGNSAEPPAPAAASGRPRSGIG